MSYDARDNNQPSKSWFCVWNNPQELITDTTDEKEIAKRALDIFIGDSPTRSGAVAYCVSAQGLIHLHMVLEDVKAMRFTAIKKIYPKAHLEPTKGSKEQAENYIQKKGAWTEKDEKVLCIVRHGEIKGAQGQRKDIDAIEQFLNEGMTPNQIFDMYMGYRRFEKMIKDAYYRKREKETPFIREVKVYWHVGLSGSGKSYVAQQIIDKYGEENLYFVTDYDGGGLDRYCGEKVLFLDEFKGQIRFSTLLSMLHGYKSQFHARYTNVTGLWDEVHITSVFPPELVYSRMVSEDRNIDTVKQLLRRITEIVYHYQKDGEFLTYHETMDKYIDYDSLKKHCDGLEDDYAWQYVQESIPFD